MGLKNWLIVSLLSFSFVSYGQQISFELGLIDATTEEPLVGATVVLGNIGGVTDVYGKAAFNVAPGQYAVTCQFIGYDTYRDTLNIGPSFPVLYMIRLSPSHLLLETATVTTTRNKTSLGEATVSLDIIKPDFIRRNNGVTIDGILDRIPGVQILDGQANIRGGSGYSYGAGSRVMLLLDDVPVLQADAGFPNWRDMPVENAGQVEVVKGAGSTLYGSAALNGIINLKTDYARSKPETEALLFSQVLDRPSDPDIAWWKKGEAPLSYGGHIIHRRKWQKLDLIGGLYHLKRNSHYENAGQKHSRAYANLRYRFTDRLVASLGAMVNGGETSSFFYWKGEGLLQGDTSAYSSGKFTRIYVDPRVSYFDRKGNQHRFLGRWMYVDNDNNNDQGNNSHWFYGEYQFHRGWGNGAWNLNAGLVGTRAWTDSPLFQNTRIKTTTAAAYVQMEHRPTDKLIISGGARYEYSRFFAPDVFAGDTLDQNTLKEARPIFRIGANYQSGKATYWRLSWGEGYRFPTIAEKFISTNAGVLMVSPNPGLDSETGWTAEIGVKQGFRLGNFQGFADLSAFWSQYRDMMEFTLVLLNGAFTFQSQNIGDTRIGGLEFSVAGQGSVGAVNIDFMGGYTYLDPRFLEFDLSGNDIPINERDNATAGQLNAANSSVDYNILKYRSRHQFKSDVMASWKIFNLGWAIRQASHVEAIDRIFELALPGVRDYRQKHDQGYWVHDLRIGVALWEHHHVTILGQNIFNENYSVRPGMLEAPRSLTVQYRLTL